MRLPQLKPLLFVLQGGFCKHSSTYQTGFPFQALTAVEQGMPESTQCGRPRFFPWLKKSKINRIIGGWEAKPFSLPWMASIQFHFRERLTHLCGGTIICLNPCNTTDSVLSAAHCVIQNGKILPANQMIVVAGTHDFKLAESNTRQITPVKSYRDAGYEAKSGRNDLLLVKLVRNIRFSHYVQPVCLPSRKDVLTTGTLCFVAGWGKTTELGRTEFPSRLSMADVYVRRMGNCKQHFGLAVSKKLQICASGNQHRSTCTGDSGGPLICESSNKFVVFGVTSYGKNCSLENVPSIYTKVSMYLEWIYNSSK